MMTIDNHEVTNPDRYASSAMQQVIVIWTELPETVSIYHGFVNPHQFEALKACHGIYINSENELEHMIKWFYNDDGELLLRKSWNLSKQSLPIDIDTKITVFETGFLL